MKHILYIIYILLTATIWVSCLQSDEPQPDNIETLDDLRFRADFLLIKDQSYAPEYLAFDLRVYLPEEDQTNFSSNYEYYTEESKQDTIALSPYSKVYLGCEYQYLILTHLIIEDSLNVIQYLSKEFVIDSIPNDSTFILNWPKDSIFFTRRN